MRFTGRRSARATEHQGLPRSPRLRHRRLGRRAAGGQHQQYRGSAHIHTTSLHISRPAHCIVRPAGDGSFPATRQKVTHDG